MKAIFLDRDGVLNDNKKPVNKPSDLTLYPWVNKSLDILKKLGFTLFVVTNQGGISCGYFTAEDLESIHNELNILTGDKICEIVYCPHFKEKCSCRKPEPGMIDDLIKRYNIDRSKSFMIGDRDVDIIAGKSAHLKSIKIGSPLSKADYTVNNLLEAVKIIEKLTISNNKYHP